MQISTTTNLNLITTLLGSSTSSTTGAGTSSSSASSLFGDSALLSLGSTTASSGVYQFDLSAVYGSTASVPTQAVSPAQQKQEAAAIGQAFTLIDGGDYDGARTLMNNLLAKNGTNAAAVQALGYAEQSAGNYEQAEQFFLRAHALSPTVGYDRDAQNARILQLDDDEALGRARAMVATPTYREEGVRVLIAITERSPDNAAAHVDLANALLQQGDTANALMQLDTAIRTADAGLLGTIESRATAVAKAYPDSAFAQQLVGKAQMQRGNYEEAITTLTQAAALSDGQAAFDVTLARAYVGRGRQKLDSGDVTAAMSDFEHAKELSPSDTDVKRALGEGLVARAEKSARLRDYDAAVTDYSTAADMFATLRVDDDVRTRAAHGAFMVGQALQTKRVAAGDEIDGEVAAYQAAYDLDNSNLTHKKRLAEARNALGDQLSAAGELEDAAYAYKRAYSLFRYDKTYKQNTINAFMAWGDEENASLNYDDAIKAYREAYTLDQFNTENKQKLADAYNARGLDNMSWEHWKLAVKDFKEALHLFPDNATYQANYNLVSPWDTDDDED